MTVKAWTTKDGQKIPIKEMTATHLANTIALIERQAEAECVRLILEGENFLPCVNGEYAQDSIENDLDNLMDYGLNPNEIHPMYDDLVAEQIRGQS